MITNEKEYLLEELKAKSAEQLNEELVSAKKELFNLRFQNATNQLDNTARITEVRKTSLGFRLLSLRKRKREKGEQNNGKKSEKNPYR